MNTNRTLLVPGRLVALLVLLFLLTLSFFLYGNIRAGQEPADLIFSALLLSIPLLLLWFSVGALVMAARQHRVDGQVSSRLAKILYWTPRIAAIVIALFIMLFSLDVFDQGMGFWEAIGAFLIHSLPSIVLGILIAVAWRKPVVGFVAFLLAAIFFIRTFFGDPFMAVGNFFLFTAPLAVIAALFWVDWKWLRQENSVGDSAGR